MDVRSFINLTKRPPLFEPSPASIWTDPWINRQLVAAQLDESTDAASRKRSQRDRTVAWIADRLPERPCRILDLGCGPGLYAEAFAARGHAVRGVDFSGPAIERARLTAEAAGLGIEYLQGDYRDLDFGSGWDAICMIYCDLGALSPADADLILAKAKAALAPEGLLVFDVFGPTLAEERKPLKSWYRSGGPGFWSEQPHLVMEETFSYPEARAFASQTVVVGDGEPEATLYRTWDRWFDEDSLTAMLRRAGYLTLEIRGDLIEPNDFAPSGVLFAAATPETGSVGERSRGA